MTLFVNYCIHAIDCRGLYMLLFDHNSSLFFYLFNHVIHILHYITLDALRNRLHKRFHTVFTSLKLANVETLAYTNHITSLYLPLYDHSDIVLIFYVGDCCW